MTVTVLIPMPLRPYTGNQQFIEMEGEKVADILNGLAARYPLLRKNLFTEDGELRGFVNVFVNEDDIRFLEKARTPVRDSDVISLIPSIAGG